MSDEELKKYYEVHTDCWKFLKKYLTIMGRIDEDSFWDALVNEDCEIYAKHGNTPFVKGMLIVAVKEVERVYRKDQEKNNEQSIRSSKSIDKNVGGTGKPDGSTG